VVTAYIDEPTAILEIGSAGKGFFKEATLHPRITITDPSKIKDAEALHEDAHKKCFIANSINFPVKVDALFNF
jgi:organic hydroperoxide reductase OsmC/OhrA